MPSPDFTDIDCISFCHQDNSTLTLAGNALYQLNTPNGEIMYHRTVASKYLKQIIHVTANHLLINMLVGARTKSTLLLENVYILVNVCFKQTVCGRQAQCCLYTRDGKYLIVVTASDIHLMNITTLSTLSTCRQIYGGSKENHVFTEGNFIHLAFAQSATYWNVAYHEIIVSYRITENQHLTPERVTYVPFLDLKDTTPDVCYTMLDHSGFSLVKTLDPDTKATIKLRTLTYGKPEEFDFRSYYDADIIDYSLSSWAPACINADFSKIYDPIPGRASDLQTFDKCFKPYANNIVYKNGIYYEHRLPVNQYIELYAPFNRNSTPISYSRRLAALYYMDTSQQRIFKYSIDEKQTTCCSCELYNNFLLFGCNFSNCTGLYQNPRVYMWGPYTGSHIPTTIWEGYLE